jgi:hypothetical protein
MASQAGTRLGRVLDYQEAFSEKGGATAGAAEKQRRNRPSRGRIPTVFGGRVETLRFLHTFVVAGGHKTVGCAENIWFLHTH